MKKKPFYGNEEWLDKAIKWAAGVIALIAVAFIGFYFYFQSTMGVETPVYDSTKALEDNVRRKPLDPEARVRLGWAYMYQERFDEAIKQFNEALKIDSEYQSAIVFLGQAYFEQKKFDKALEYFQRETDLYKDAGYSRENKWLEQAYFDMSVIYWQQKNYDKAIENILLALTIRPSDADNHFFLARLYLEKGDFAKAAVSFEKAVNFDPNYSDAHLGLAKANEGLKEPGWAVIEYQRAYDTALEQQAELKKKAYSKIDSLVKELEAKNKDPEVKAEDLVQLGLAQIGLGEYDKAVETFNQALSKKKDYYYAYFGLGYANEKAGKKTEAKSYYQKALKSKKDFTRALAAIKRLELGLSESDVITRD